MKKFTKAELELRTKALEDLISYIDDPRPKNAILRIVHVYNSQLLRTLEQEVFARRTTNIAEAEALIERARQGMAEALNSGVGISDAEQALIRAYKIRDIHEAKLVAPVDMNSDIITLDDDFELADEPNTALVKPRI